MKAYIYNDEMGMDITVTDIPEDMVDQAEEYREAMVESICETDDELILKFLEGEEITDEELKAALRSYY